MSFHRKPLAAALCTLALAATPLAYAAGDSYGTSSTTTSRSHTFGSNRTDTFGTSAGTMHGSAGMSSEQVRQVQQQLTEKGYAVGPIDGVMGPRTRAALRSYQQQNNLSGATGLDQQTLESLGVQSSAGTTAGGRMASSAGTREVPTASGSNASTGTASDGGMADRNGRDFGNSGSRATGSSARSASGATPSGSNASDGTASDGGPNSSNPSNKQLTRSREADRALNPSAPGSNASDGTASDGGIASKNPSGTRPGEMGASSAGGNGAATGGAGGR